MPKFLALLFTAGLAACVGNDVVDESDAAPAAVGAGAGAVAGEAISDDPLVGAGIGAGAGAVANDL